MAGAHEHYEAMAVGHVLGGLSVEQASAFRDHLLDCRSCRERVAELRGIADELAAAERDERSRAAVRTELAQTVEQDEDLAFDAGRRLQGRHLAVMAVALALVLGLLGFWNLHLRALGASSAAVVAQQETTLELLASGVPLTAEAGDGITAIAATDGERLAISVAGIDPLGPDEVLVGWMVGGSLAGPQAALLVRRDQVGGGPIAVTRATDGAAEFVLTRERGRPGDAPGEQRLLTVALRGGGG
jgi:hypothetical protein